jgi:hypothetical protein
MPDPEAPADAPLARLKGTNRFYRQKPAGQRLAFSPADGTNPKQLNVSRGEFKKLTVLNSTKSDQMVLVGDKEHQWHELVPGASQDFYDVCPANISVAPAKAAASESSTYVTWVASGRVVSV